MPTLFESIKGLIMRQKQDERAAEVLSVRTVFTQTAREKLGLAIDSPIDPAKAVPIIKAADPNIDEAATINRAIKRYEWAANAARLAELEKQGATADKACDDHRAAEIERVRLAREKYLELQEAARVAAVEYQRAVIAHGELMATADATPEEEALSRQLTEVSEALTRCKSALNRHSSGSHLAMLSNLRDTLDRTPKHEAKQRAELEQRIPYYEKAIIEATADLARHEKQYATIITKIKKLATDKLKPENFAFVYRQPKRITESQLVGV